MGLVILGNIYIYDVTERNLKGGAACLPCMAALGPPGIQRCSYFSRIMEHVNTLRTRYGGGLTTSRALQSPQKQEKNKKKIKG